MSPGKTGNSHSGRWLSFPCPAPPLGPHSLTGLQGVQVENHPLRYVLVCIFSVHSYETDVLFVLFFSSRGMGPWDGHSPPGCELSWFLVSWGFAFPGEEFSEAWCFPEQCRHEPGLSTWVPSPALTHQICWSHECSWGTSNQDHHYIYFSRKFYAHLGTEKRGEKKKTPSTIVPSL